MADEDKKKKKVNYASAWKEAKVLIWNYRFRLALGGVLMILSRLSGLVLPASSKYLIDEVIGKQRYELLKWIALAVGISTLVQAITSFALTQILGIAAQRAITEMRKRVQTQIEKLPISYFDSTQIGQLISRIMNDAEGIRNLVGTGLVQLSRKHRYGGDFHCRLVLYQLAFDECYADCSGGISAAFWLTHLRNCVRFFVKEMSSTPKLPDVWAKVLGGIRIVKAYTAEKREELIFARGAHRLLRNVAKSMTGVSAITAFSSLIIGAISVVMIFDRRKFRHHRRDDHRRSFYVYLFHGFDGVSDYRTDFHRHTNY